MPTGVQGGSESAQLQSSTAVGGWRVFTHTLARTSPQALAASRHYRMATLRVLASKRKVVR